MNESLPLVVSLGVSVIAWIIADARSKSRVAYIDDRVMILERESGLLQQARNELEIKLARSEQDRQEIHRGLERLDDSKASKEVVEGFRGEMATLRVDMDKRFDRLERILTDRFKLGTV